MPGEREQPPPAADSTRPIVEMLVIAAPTVVTMTSYTVMQFIDGLMVSRIGPDEVYVSAQGNGGMVVWFAMAFFLGLTGVINTYVSQNLGAGTPRKGAAYAWNGLWICAAAAVVMAPFALALPHLFNAMHSTDGRLVGLELGYARILLAGAFLTMGARAIAQFFYGMHKPTVVMVSVLAANVVNVCANAVLIFGDAGAPESMPLAGFFRSIAGALGIAPMGVSGAALGTVIGTAVEFVVPFLVFLGPRFNRAYGTRGAWRLSMPHVRDLWKIGWPGGLMFANEMICWGYLMIVLLGRAGVAAGGDAVVHNTAGWIALRYMHLSFMPTVGLSIAVTAIVGKCMGMGRPDLAAARAWLGLRIALLYMGACALAFVLFRERLIAVFTPADMTGEAVQELVRVGSVVMIAAAVFQLFDAIAITMSGALRGAGDTVWPGVVTIILSWTCIMGGGYAMITLMPDLGSLGPWIAASAYIIALGIAFLARFAAGRWKSIKLVNDRPGLEAVAEAAPGSA